MSKVLSIVCLFGFLILLFSINLMIGNPIRETFKGNDNGINLSDQINDEDPIVNIIKGTSDDEPLNFGFH